LRKLTRGPEAGKKGVDSFHGGSQETKAHRSRLNRNFGEFLGGKKVVVLNIPDDFEYMDAELISLLESRGARYLP
jgi:predicted protein tyrosine phosphatase